MPKFKSAAYRNGVLSCAALALAGVLFVGFTLQLFAAQETHKPLAEKEVINLLTNDVPPTRVAGFAKQFGISFQVTPEVEDDLRDAGATDALIQTLKLIAPKPAAPAQPAKPKPAPPPAPPPPVLVIQSQPGDAQVYIDDVPVGTTSSEGRIKLPDLSRGTHRVRVSLEGYRDFERNVDLRSGTYNVLARLVHLPPPSPPVTESPVPPKPSAISTPVRRPGKPGVLGIFLAKQSVAGQGMLIQGLVPGSPAEDAGLRPGAYVYSIAGRVLRSPNDVKQALLGRTVGESVSIVWGIIGNERKANVTLASSSIYSNAPHFWVAHDHGPPAPNYCVGWLTILDGMVIFKAQRAVGGSGIKHTFEFPFSQIKEVKRNNFYMAALGAFHIRTRSGKLANFIVLNAQGQHQPPNQLLQTLEQAMAKY